MGRNCHLPYYTYIHLYLLAGTFISHITHICIYIAILNCQELSFAPLYNHTLLLFDPLCIHTRSNTFWQEVTCVPYHIHTYAFLITHAHYLLITKTYICIALIWISMFCLFFPYTLHILMHLLICK